MSASIKVRNLNKIFALAERGGRAASLFEALRAGHKGANVREVHALQDVGFDVARGERIGIIGANGAGKTTLLSILAGLTDATSGTVEIEGDIHAMLTIGDVVREDLTGRENIYLDASVHGRSRGNIDATVEEIIAFTELGEFIERPVRTYSSGMKARLAFAMGAFINADILILDETLSVGDVFFEKKAATRMRALTGSGSIVILVSHGMKSIVEHCTRCIWLEGGRLVMDGSPTAVVQAYEKAVRSADESDLKRKFSEPDATARRPDRAMIEIVTLSQGDQVRAARLAAMRPTAVEVHGRVGHPQGGCELHFGLVRVDGRRIWSASAAHHGLRLPDRGSFVARIEMEPFILGADLYRLDVILADSEGSCDSMARVFEVVDEEGQIGGKPLLLYPPTVTVRPN